jgi:hypothetical protein
MIEWQAGCIREPLTPPPLRRKLVPTMPAGFDAAFAKGKELVADFRANEKFCHFYTKRRDGPDKGIKHKFFISYK